MKIRLSEIPAEGRAYTFNRESGELNHALEDLVNSHPYDVELYIKPIGNAYEMRGKVKATVTDVCSRCGWDIDLSVERPVNEILMEEEEDHRKSHSVHGNQSVDFLGEGPAMVPYRGEVFNAADFVHEMVALAQPFYPSCGVEDCEHLEDVRKAQAELEQSFAKAEEEKEKGHPGFSVLKGLSVETEKKR